MGTVNEGGGRQVAKARAFGGGERLSDVVAVAKQEMAHGGLSVLRVNWHVSARARDWRPRTHIHTIVRERERIDDHRHGAMGWISVLRCGP